MVVGNITLYPKKNKKFALRGQRANFLYNLIIYHHLSYIKCHISHFLSKFFLSKIKSSLCRTPQTCHSETQTLTDWQPCVLFTRNHQTRCTVGSQMLRCRQLQQEHPKKIVYFNSFST